MRLNLEHSYVKTQDNFFPVKDKLERASVLFFISTGSAYKGH